MTPGTLFPISHNPDGREVYEPPYAHGSATSHEAAERIKPHLTDQQARALAAIADSPTGRTRQEVCPQTGLPEKTVTARVVELIRQGRIRETGETRPTTSGRSAAVLKAT